MDSAKPLRFWQLLSSGVPSSSELENFSDSTIFTRCEDHVERLHQLRSTFHEAKQKDKFYISPERLFGMQEAVDVGDDSDIEQFPIVDLYNDVMHVHSKVDCGFIDRLTAKLLGRALCSAVTRVCVHAARS